MEFFFLIVLCHLGVTAVFFGILTEFLPKKKKNVIESLSLFVLVLVIPIILFNSNRVQNEIDLDGIFINGIVEKKKTGSKSVRWLECKFNYNGMDYESTFHMKIKDFNKVSIGDSVLIKFIEKHPKLNRTEKVINK